MDPIQRKEATSGAGVASWILHSAGPSPSE